jgi:hypothetical protein
MTSIILTAVDSTLTFNADDLSGDLLMAYQYTTTFAQAAARKATNGIIHPAYFEEVVRQYQRLGWFVSDTGTIHYEQSSFRGSKVVPADFILKVAKPYLSSKQLPPFQDVLMSLQYPYDNDIRGLLDFWWGKGQVSESQHHFALGDITVTKDQLTANLTYWWWDFALDRKQSMFDKLDHTPFDSWQSLFDELDPKSIKYIGNFLTMRLDMEKYRNIEDQLRDKLLGHEKDHIKSAPLEISD